MLQIEQIKELYDYNDWASERLWQAVGGLSTDQLNIDMHNGIGSIFTTLIHLVGAAWIWRTRWEGGMPTRFLPVEDFSTLESIRTRWQEEEEHIQRFLTTLLMKISRESFVISVPQLPTRYLLCLSGNRCCT